MPLFSKISAYSFNKESFWVMSGYLLTKNILLAINFLSFIAGLVLIGGGGYIQANAMTVGEFGFTSAIASAAIIIGVFVTLVSFLGCFGAANEKGMMLKTYFAFLLILVILEISIGIAALVKQEEIGKSLDLSWANGNNATISKIEESLHCCGYKNITQNTFLYNCTGLNPLAQPCYYQISSSISNSLTTIMVGGLAIGAVEMLGLILSVGMFRRLAIRKKEQDVLLQESWRVNKDKIQHGYQNYQV